MNNQLTRCDEEGIPKIVQWVDIGLRRWDFQVHLFDGRIMTITHEEIVDTFGNLKNLADKLEFLAVRYINRLSGRSCVNG